MKITLPPHPNTELLYYRLPMGSKIMRIIKGNNFAHTVEIEDGSIILDILTDKPIPIKEQP